MMIESFAGFGLMLWLLIAPTAFILWDASRSHSPSRVNQRRDLDQSGLDRRNLAPA
jgi:hypothetical protein